MAGARIEISANTQVVGEALHNAFNVLASPQLLLEDIGEYLVGRTRDHFRNEESPEGHPWAALSPTYEEMKNPNPGFILQRSGDLARQIFAQVNGQELFVGTDRIYGATMQFGARQGQFGMGGKRKRHPLPWGDIPARPFLGIGDTDEQEILLIVQDHLLAVNN